MAAVESETLIEATDEYIEDPHMHFQAGLTVVRHPLADEQARRNTEARHTRQLYGSHRAAVSAIVLQNGDAQRTSLCVLGAGNANDLDLDAIVGAYSRVHLVDLDEAALHFASERLSAAQVSKITLHGRMDISGILPQLERFVSARPTGTELLPLLALAAEPQPAQIPASSVVISTCILSQLIDSARIALGEEHPQLLDLVRAIRLGHLRLLCRTTLPEGRAILVTDVVSSDTVPDLRRVPDNALGSLLMQLVRQRNFLTGLNPFAIVEACKCDAEVRQSLSTVRVVYPWKWQYSADRTYIVSALVLRRKP